MRGDRRSDRVGDAGRRSDASRHRPAGRARRRSRVAALLGPLRARPPLRRAGAHELALEANSRARPQPHHHVRMKTLALSDPSVLDRVRGLPKGVIDALRRLEHGASEDDIAQEVIDNAGAGALPSLYHALHRLRGFVSHTLHWQGAALATLTPLSTAHGRAEERVRPDERYRLSRFASAHREDSAWIVE